MLTRCQTCLRAQVGSNSASGGQEFVAFETPLSVDAGARVNVSYWVAVLIAVAWSLDADLVVPARCIRQADLHVNFDGRVPIKFDLVASQWRCSLKLAPPAGELLVPQVKSEAGFDEIAGACADLRDVRCTGARPFDHRSGWFHVAGRLGGMHANKVTVTLASSTSISDLVRSVTDAANVNVVVATPGAWRLWVTESPCRCGGVCPRASVRRERRLSGSHGALRR